VGPVGSTLTERAPQSAVFTHRDLLTCDTPLSLRASANPVCAVAPFSTLRPGLPDRMMDRQ
jgi:hypothetical protein